MKKSFIFLENNTILLYYALIAGAVLEKNIWGAWPLIIWEARAELLCRIVQY